MIYLLLSILSSTAIFALFKLFNTYNINTLQAIVVNYFTACICGLLFIENTIAISQIIKSDWFYGALILGFLFITVFNIMAMTAQKNGLSIASVASKMSVIIPVVFGIIIYNESLNTQKILGIILALVAVFLITIKPKTPTSLKKTIYLPILLFLGSGIIDTSVNHFAPDNNIPLFSATIFGIAGIIGLPILISKSSVSKNYFKLKSIPFGVVLGIVNYASIYFLLKALRVDHLDTSTIFTINNVAIVAVSTLIGLVLFKEKISTKSWVGIAIALISIILVTLNNGN
ncbi:MAG: EamA family transporter [Winogradskyella sp.]